MPPATLRALRLPFFAATLALSTFAPPASSASLTVGAGTCGFELEAVEWTPTNGAVARFVAVTFAHNQRDGVWIGLGTTKTAFWSAEGTYDSDLCYDTCRSLYLVETRLDGSRRRHLVARNLPLATTPAEEDTLVAQLLPALFRLAKKTWPIAELRRPKAITLGASTSAGPPPFAVQVALENGTRLRYVLSAKLTGCSCEMTWSAALAP
jgi:hypothetical protein